MSLTPCEIHGNFLRNSVQLIVFSVTFYSDNIYNLRFHCFWATVCKTVRSMLSDRCLSCLSVTMVYCGQTVGWIKMKLGTQVGLGPGHIILDGDLTKKGEEPPIFGPCLLWKTTGCIKMPLGMEVGLGPGHIVLDGDTAPPKKGAAIFDPCLLWPNGWMDQDASAQARSC